ncbi:hypothetical protein R1flu_027771 [Riccia fluitans]|uniref:Uncharacterized protein n=1 Tax=Riccia fluitans TaxID=41844 RepID=A0ABD1XKG3_9MARC
MPGIRKPGTGHVLASPAFSNVGRGSRGPRRPLRWLGDEGQQGPSYVHSERRGGDDRSPRGALNEAESAIGVIRPGVGTRIR